MAQIKYTCTGVNDYCNVFIVGSAGINSKVKMMVIWEMIQIIHHSKWTLENLKSIFDGLGQIDNYN